MAYVYKGAQLDVDPVVPPIPGKDKPGPKPKPHVFDPSHCGTYRGYKQHERTGTEKCQPCKDANAAYSRDYEARLKTGKVRTLRRGFRPDACGTYAGYCRHLRHKVPACVPCTDASRAHTAEHRAKRKAAA